MTSVLAPPGGRHHLTPRRGFQAFAIALLLAMFACQGDRAVRAAAPPTLDLWLYGTANLAEDGEVQRLEKLFERAVAAGYRHMMLADEKFARLGEMKPEYLANAGRVRDHARALGLEIVPAVFPVGRSGSLLAATPDLAEGLPVRDAKLVVRGGLAVPVADPPVKLGAHPDLIDPSLQLVDGTASSTPHGSAQKMYFNLDVAPDRAYHVSLRVRTEKFDGDFRIQVRSGSKALYFGRSLDLAGDQDWKRYDAMFNSLDARSATIMFVVRSHKAGILAWRDWAIEEAGPVNVLRRPATPFVVRGRVEGRDFETVRDPKLGQVPWRGQFDEWHEPPAIRTSLPEGTELRASWHHAAVIYGRIVTCCIADPGTTALLRDQQRRVRELFHPSGCLMQHDEIRVMNRDASCKAQRSTPGRLLAAHVRECVAMLDGLTVYAWNDMFDPRQNAVREYMLVDGDLAGSWEGLDPKVVIVNWNGEHARESLRFFAGRGHRQIIAGYYDGPVESIHEWFEAAEGVPNVVGVMYTTWQNDYDDLEAFARACRER